MQRREIVKRAIEFRTPPRLPFWQNILPDAPSDVCDCWEMDRQRCGWFFDTPEPDDWGCGWNATGMKNMGQVVHHPLADWSAMDGWSPPDPKDPFYYDRLEERLAEADDRYVAVSCHFNLIERLHMLRGFDRALMDLATQPERAERLLDIILEFRLEQFDELARRYGDRIDGLFLTDDWGTQQGTFISQPMFKRIFLPRYRQLSDKIHEHGWHFMLHSCGRVNDFIPLFIEAGVDVLNLQQPLSYGIEEIGKTFGGKTCFLTTVDIQATMPSSDLDAIRDEALQLVCHWSRPEGGLIVFNYGDDAGIGTTAEATTAMFEAFDALKDFHQLKSRVGFSPP